MKIIFSLVALMAFSSISFACKPGPLPSCEGKKSILLKADILTQLKSRVSEFQALLDESIYPPKDANSCFNNHFAGFYLNALQEAVTCEDQLALVHLNVSQLITMDNWKEFKSDDKKAKVEAMAGEVKSVWLYFKKEHAN